MTAIGNEDDALGPSARHGVQPEALRTGVSDRAALAVRGAGALLNVTPGRTAHDAKGNEGPRGRFVHQATPDTLWAFLNSMAPATTSGQASHGPEPTLSGGLGRQWLAQCRGSLSSPNQALRPGPGS
jgi:hypothetical protein